LSLQRVHDRAVEEGSRIYYHTLRPTLECPENLGKILAIDVDSGDYEIDDDGNAAVARIRAKHPDHLIYRMRVGAKATYTMAGPPRSGK
jgi:hypothetical protein